jgi:integrase
MGFSRKRLGTNGKPRYTAYYMDLRGRELSAGTFASKKAADKAWQKAEAKVAEGRGGDPARNKQSFRRYVEEEWLPHHVMEATTREGYTYSIYAHIMDWFGTMRMAEILPSDVRAWVKDQQDRGLSPTTIKLNKSILSGIFTTALNDQITALHPCKDVKTPTLPKKPLRIVAPEEFDRLYIALPTEPARLLAETAIESGMRWGELTELRVKDLELISRIVTVSRTVVEVNAKHHPEGKRFLIKEYPKDKEYRRFKLSPQIASKLKAYIADSKLERDDLLFVYQREEPAPQPEVQPVEHLGLTEPNAAGRRIGTAQGQVRAGYLFGGFLRPSRVPDLVVTSGKDGHGDVDGRQLVTEVFGDEGFEAGEATNAGTFHPIWMNQSRVLLRSVRWKLLP